METIDGFLIRERTLQLGNHDQVEYLRERYRVSFINNLPMVCIKQ